MDDSGWKYFKPNNESFIVRRRFSADTFKLQFSDHRRLWSVDGTASELLTMSKSENPLFEFDQSKVTKNIFNLFDKSLNSLTVDGNDVCLRILKMSSDLGNRPFSLVWTLYEQSPDALYEEVTRPLLYCLGEMTRHQNYLCCLLIDKDKEITEYTCILENVKLPWGSIKTEKFDPEKFKNNNLSNCYRDPDPIATAWDKPEVICMFNKHVCGDEKKTNDGIECELTNPNEVVVKKEETVADHVPVDPTIEATQVKEVKADDPSNTQPSRSKRKKVKLNL